MGLKVMWQRCRGSVGRLYGISYAPTCGTSRLPVGQMAVDDDDDDDVDDGWGVDVRMRGSEGVRVRQQYGHQHRWAVCR